MDSILQGTTPTLTIAIDLVAITNLEIDTIIAS